MDSNKVETVPTLPGPKVAYAGDAEEPYPSLSDYHDYEPNLEFDDSELHQSPDAIIDAVELIQEMEPDDLGSPISDYTDENFEDELAEPFDRNFDSMISAYPVVGDEDKFVEIANYGIVDVKGDDDHGRKIIVVYACKLPSVEKMNHELFLEYLLYTLDKYVEQDYSLVYFHYGLHSKNKPSIRWLWQAYKAFDRKYKKNLKALYMVHPTGFLKILLQMFRPVISVKFGKKLNYISNLAELNQHIEHLEQLSIPQEVIEYDKKIFKCSPTTKNEAPKQEKQVPTKQFGSTINAINAYYKTDIPPVVRQCVTYLDKPELLETEGLFRRSGNSVKVKELKDAADLGEELEFTDPHEATVLVKLFLRELKEPLLTFELYDEVLNFQMISKDKQIRQASILVMEKMPEENYKILKYLIKFLSRVMERSDLNKMNAPNLAVCFGPNLVWSENKSMSLGAIGHINNFTQFLLQHHREIFIV